MHKSHYRPTRSQQLFLIDKIKEVYAWDEDTIVIHHVLEDSPTKLLLQIERRWNSWGGLRFERIYL